MTWQKTAGGIVVALAAFELLVRHLAWGHPIVDPQLGWSWQSTTVFHRLQEGWGVSNWDERGARVHAARAAGAPRVLVLGDSFTEALQVNDEEVFTARLKSIDAINVGRSAASAADYAAFADVLQARFHPAWTVIEVGPPDFGGDAFDPTKTHFDARLEPVVVPPRFGRISRLLMSARDHCAVVDVTVARWQAYRAAAKMPPLFRAADADTPRGVGAPALGRAPEAWPVEREMELLTARWNGRVTFLFIPQEPDGVEGQFLAACARRGWSCVDLRAAFDDFRARGDSPFGFPNSRFGQGHLNARGHAAAASLLEAELERLRRRGLF